LADNEPQRVRNGQNRGFSSPKSLQIQKTAIFRPFLVFYGLEKASEGIFLGHFIDLLRR